MRETVPSWIWSAVGELERLMGEGKVQVPLPLTEEDVKYWRSILG